MAFLGLFFLVVVSSVVENVAENPHGWGTDECAHDDSGGSLFPE